MRKKDIEERRGRKQKPTLIIIHYSGAPRERECVRKYPYIKIKKGGKEEGSLEPFAARVNTSSAYTFSSLPPPLFYAVRIGSCK